MAVSQGSKIKLQIVKPGLINRVARIAYQLAYLGKKELNYHHKSKQLFYANNIG